MQYCDYIAHYNARREREQQLIQQYSQRPKGPRVQNLWLHQVDKSVCYKATVKEFIWAAAGIIGAGFILLLSIWL